jgi:S1-C subfamily serine protease
VTVAGRARIFLGLGIFGAAAAGAALALGGAAALGAFSATSTTTIREVGAAGATATATATAFRTGKALSVNEIYRRDAPGVVQVTATQVVKTQSLDPFFGFSVPQRQRQQALGSGFVIDKGGHIVTNYHVVQGARTVRVSFSNNESMKARIVGSDPSTDVAVLQVDVHSRALTPLTLGNSDDVHVGDSVVAIGNPLGLDRTVTAGIVSALQRVIAAPDAQYSIDHVIQTDAALNHGNSGGPLLDADGNVIGVNSQIQSDTGSNIGIGFAVPIDTVKTVAAQIIKTGHAEHAFLGIRAQPVTPAIALLFRLPAASGLLVASVDPGSAAAQAGLRAGKQQVTVSGETYPLGGDLIVAADGVRLYSLDQLRDVISAKQPGNTIALEIWRGDNKQTLDVKLGRQPSP